MIYLPWRVYNSIISWLLPITLYGIYLNISFTWLSAIDSLGLRGARVGQYYQYLGMQWYCWRYWSTWGTHWSISPMEMLITLDYVGHALDNIIDIPYTTRSASDTLSSLVRRGARDDQCYWWDCWGPCSAWGTHWTMSPASPYHKGCQWSIRWTWPPWGSRWSMSSMVSVLSYSLDLRAVSYTHLTLPTKA